MLSRDAERQQKPIRLTYARADDAALALSDPRRQCRSMTKGCRRMICAARSVALLA